MRIDFRLSLRSDEVSFTVNTEGKAIERLENVPLELLCGGHPGGWGTRYLYKGCSVPVRLVTGFDPHFPQ